MILDKNTFQRTVNFLRKQFLWSDQYKKTKARCLIAYSVYRCEGCGRAICKTEESYNLFTKNNPNTPTDEISQEKFAVDHVVPVGSLQNRSLDEAASKIFCHETNLMGLCGTCHAFKTYVDLEEIREKKISLLEQFEKENWKNHHN